MSVRLGKDFIDRLGALRSEPTPFRIRGHSGPQLVVDSRAAVLVWRPKWVTPVYGVPREDVHVTVIARGPARALTESESRRPVLDPSVAFDAHTSPGEVVELQTAGGPVAGFVCEDPDLRDLVLVDFDGLTWHEEEQEVVAHPRDPFHRIDVRATSARLQLSSAGVELVDTIRAKLLWETMLPVRWYVPADDVLVPFEPSGTTTSCSYKGRATYRTLVAGDRRLEDLAWVYERPLSDGEAVRGLLGFYAERLDVRVDGEPVVATNPFAGGTRIRS